MRVIPGSVSGLIVALACVAAGCSGSSPGGGAPGTGGAPEETGGSTGGSGSGGTGGRATGGSGGSPVTADAAAERTPDAATGATPEVSMTTPDAGWVEDDGGTPMASEVGPQPSYEGVIPLYYGPEVGPTVQMNCPEDPTQGWTEYREGFHVERPYNVPINTRFSITGGIYNFWVFPNDRPHSTAAQGRNPRTEATYGGIHDKENIPGGTGVYSRVGYFTSGMRMYSADMLIERSAVGSAIMQIHTTSAGGGPIGLRIQGNGNMVNNGSLTVVNGSTVPGGLVDKWFNFKASLDTASLEVKIYINNCLKSTYKGNRGDGHFYFKNGVYFCDAGGGCRTHFKNVHFYKK
jgi:hypothetical protein